MAKLASRRYLLSLSLAEGFGLVPLEAMAVGTCVVGFDGFGGREYMVSGSNCIVRPYGDIDAVVMTLVRIIEDDRLAERLTRKAEETASSFTRREFELRWRAELQSFVENSLG